MSHRTRLITSLFLSVTPFAQAGEQLVPEGQLSAFWIDPRDGKQVRITTLPAAWIATTFSTPEGWEDALLVLEEAGG